VLEIVRAASVVEAEVAIEAVALESFDVAEIENVGVALEKQAEN